MRFEATNLPGAFLIDLEPREDERGFFARAWCAREFAEHGLESTMLQVNLSYNRRRGTLRGLHYQRPPHAEAKLIRCIRGALYDTIVDLRPGSATFGQPFGAELSAENRRMLYVPAGFAHGFQTLVDDTEALYQVSAFYEPGAESGIRYDEPRFALQWPLPVSAISDKDAGWPDFVDP